MNVAAMGQVGLTGLKGKLASRAAGRVAERTGVDEAKILAIIGWIFLGIWLWQTLKFVGRVIDAGREVD